MTSTYLESIRAKSEVYRRTAQTILDKASAESRALTTQEQTDIDGLLGKAENAIKSAELAQRVATPLTVPDGTRVQAGDDNRSQAPWGPDNAIGYSFGRMLRAVAAASVPGGERDPRLQRAVLGAGEGLGAGGGFAIGTQFEREILRRVYSESPILSKVRRFTLTGNANSLAIPYVDETSRANGSRWGGVTAAWTSEGDEIATSKPTLGKLNLVLKKIAALGYVTSELLEDSAEAMGQLLFDSFVAEIRFRLVDALLRGTAGMPLGILGHAATAVVSKEQGQTSKLIFDNAGALLSQIWPGSLASMEFYAHSSVLPSLLKMTVGDQPVFLAGMNAANGPQRTLLGAPIHFIEQAAALGTPGDLIAADFSQYAVVDRSGIQTAQSIHVAFTTDQRAFRAVYRVDGAPLWPSTVVPYKGSAALAPFAVLEAR